jgi:hypothetical protein
MWPRKNPPASGQMPPVTDEMMDAVRAAREKGLQSDLLVLAQRMRAEAPDRSSEFNAGIDWALLWLENTARQLTERPGRSSE